MSAPHAALKQSAMDWYVQKDRSTHFVGQITQGHSKITVHLKTLGDFGGILGNINLHMSHLLLQSVCLFICLGTNSLLTRLTVYSLYVLVF